MITVSLFDGLRNLNRVEEATADLRSARARRAEKEQEIFAELTSALAKYENGRSTYQATTAELEKALQSQDQARERYRVGRASILEVTDAELSVSRARLDMAQGMVDEQSAIALIRLITGEESI